MVPWKTDPCVWGANMFIEKELKWGFVNFRADIVEPDK